MIKYVLLVTVTILAFGGALLGQAPKREADEAEVRQLEDEERQAVLRKDVKELQSRLWSPQLVVHSPANAVGTVEATVRNVVEGLIDYLAFERKIEKITFSEDLAIVMGEELFRPQGKASNAGKIVTRRYTNIWRRSKGNWRLIARQATMIRVE